MNCTQNALLAVALLAPLAAGCASRTAPFDSMDKAQITVLRLQGVEPPPQAAAVPQAGVPGLPGIQIPGLSPDQNAQLQQLGNQVLQGAQSVIPGLPNLLPGAAAQPQAAPVQPQMPRFKGFIILAQMPLSDPTAKNEILDIFGAAKSFQAGHAPCMTPGFGISMSSPDKPGQPPVDLLISFSCNQAVGDGFRWPYPTNGLTPDSIQRLATVYGKLWGAPPPQSGG